MAELPPVARAEHWAEHGQPGRGAAQGWRRSRTRYRDMPYAGLRSEVQRAG